MGFCKKKKLKSVNNRQTVAFNGIEDHKWNCFSEYFLLEKKVNYAALFYVFI